VSRPHTVLRGQATTTRLSSQADATSLLFHGAAAEATGGQHDWVHRDTLETSLGAGLRSSGDLECGIVAGAWSGSNLTLP